MSEKKTKVAVVTGASSGIGECIVRKFLEMSVSVIAHFNKKEISADIQKNKLVRIFKADFSNPDEIENFAGFVLENSKKVDFLVNCCGASENTSFKDLKAEDLTKIYNINTFSHFILMQKIFPIMVSEKFGRIVSVSSIGVKYAGSANSMLYSSSKAALEAMTRSFAKQGAPFNVLANSVRAGVTNTDFHRNSGKNMNDRINLIPMKRMAEPEEIADAVIFLCSEKASFITGQEITVAGGE